MNVNAGGGQACRGNGGARGKSARLQREVMVPLPTYQRASVLIALSLAMVFVASAVDALVWTYQSQRRIWRDEATESLRPAMARRHAVPRAARPSLSGEPSAIAPAPIAAEDDTRGSCRFHLDRD